MHLNSHLAILVAAISYFAGTSDGSCNEVDRHSLSSFNLSISAAPPLNWSLSADCCTWEGVSCDNSSRVTSLWLPSRGLVGNMSPWLMNLTTLNLSHNTLSGPLPDGFFTSSFIVIDLSINRLSGALSPSNNLPPTIQSFNLSCNSFHGTIPSSFLETASKLQAFDVSNNSFSGSVPSSICSYSPSLERLDFSNNDFSDQIPAGFGECSKLQSLRAGFNNLSGQIPHDIYSLSTLQQLYLPGNKLSGVMNQSIASLINLKILNLYGNELTGAIPQDIGRLSNLEHLHLHINHLTGTIPTSLTNCTSLITLYLRVNSLEGELSSFDFSRFVHLKSVDLGNNLFRGSLPASLFSCKKLTAIRLASNNLSGQILPTILSLPSLSFLSLSNNSLTNITAALGILTGCKNLTTLTLSTNFHNERLPSDGDESLVGLEGLHNLRVLALGACGFTGSFPLWLSKLPKLEVVDLSFNFLTGTIPGFIGSFKELFYLDLSNNQLSGVFPIELTTMQRLAIQQSSHQIDSSYLELPVFVTPDNVSSYQYNQLSSLPTAIYLGNNSINGTIPYAIGQLKFIKALDLTGNHFSGEIPDALSKLTNLEKLDLSRNNFSGQIPSSLQNLNFLSSFSVADNNLEGPIPTGGQFDTFPVSSFQGNPELCGRILQRSCSAAPTNISPLARGRRRKKRVMVLILVICSSIFTMSLLLYFFLEKRWRRLDQKPGLETSGLDIDPEDESTTRSLVTLFPNNDKIHTLSMAEILQATHDFSQSNIIGCGGFGLVYKAVLENGTKLAIKKFSGDMCVVEREFKAEVEVLSTAQHRNLVSLKGYCMHDGDRLLIYSLMENGSLDYWLHEKPGGGAQLSWPARLRIAAGVASGVAYMHETCEPHIVHRDLKSSNILLDHNLEAHVADFGLARLILPHRTHVTTELVGTLGYIPPEYGQSWVATLRGDVYSFGVVMVELVTGKRPFMVLNPKGERELVKWVMQMRREGKLEEVFDPAIRDKGFQGEMVRVVEIASLCLNQNPLERPTMIQVVDWLKDVGRSRGSRSGSDHYIAC
ncbi:tyrosine-sulfated glycopeptide receptor 1-like [Salvia miltiorrhiza]|uniref:tyrosine-sulfated glycopeptide receptor 1-like n=1 Tax=Salvia miltiorrhiza TaxID=226208 RepID=UPI0025AC5388|nr:tyrosine-sulfated glycopeptide receptor 1-like [Salvia miltiorrhiza]